MASTLETCANTAGRPGSPSAGDTLYQIDTKQIITWDGSAWRLYDSDGTAVNDADITDLSPHLWLDPMHSAPFFTDSGKGTAVTADGKRVGCFADRSGNGFDFVQGTETAKPTLCLEAGVGAVPSLCYSQSDQLDLLGTSDSDISADQLTIFFVWRLAQEGSHWFIQGTSNSNNPRIRLNGSADSWYYQWYPFGAAEGDYSSGVDFSTTATVGSAFASRHIYCLKTDLAGADRTYTYNNGGADIAGSTTSPDGGKFLEDGETMKLFYGPSDNYSPHWLFEFLVFDSTLTDANVNKVNSYLGNKHGITVTDVS